MAGHTYMNNGYSTHTDVSAHEGGYAHGPKQPVNWYVVETTTIERIRTPAARYINFGDQEYIHSPGMLIRPNTPKDYHEGYEPDYGSDYENSSSPRYHGRESLMDKFLNKVQSKASQPVKTSNLSSPKKYQPTSPVRSHPSEEAQPIRTHNLSGSNKYQPTSPVHDYPSKEVQPIWNQSLSGPNKYQLTSPVHSFPSEKSHLTRTRNLLDPNRYQPTSSVHNYPSQESHLNKTRNLSEPNKYEPTSPEHNYPSEESHLIKTRNLSGLNKYQPTSPEHNYPSEESHLIRTRNLSNPNKHQPTSLVHSYPLEETHMIRTKNFSGPNKHHPLSSGSKSGHHAKTNHFSGPRNQWMSAGPPMTHHPLTTATNDINEALGFLEESMNYSLHLGPRRTGAFDNLSPHAQLIKSEREYVKPTFVTRPHFGTNTIDSQEAIRKYQGTRVP